jgi:hypothetical protein
MSFKLILVILVALVVAALSGWFAGASGRSVMELERNRSEMRAEFSEARALVLDGRVNLYQSNFGNAIERFQNARNLIGRIQGQLREIGQVEQAGRLEIALSHLSDAQRASAAFDITKAHAAAEQAIQALGAASGR